MFRSQRIILSNPLCQVSFKFTHCTIRNLKSKRFSLERKLTRGYTQGQLTLAQISKPSLYISVFLFTSASYGLLPEEPEKNKCQEEPEKHAKGNPR